MWHVGGCGVRVVGKMSTDIGMGVRKITVVLFVPRLLFGDSIPICLFIFSNVYCDLIVNSVGGGGGGGDIELLIDARYAHMHVSYSGDRLR